MANESSPHQAGKPPRFWSDNASFCLAVKAGIGFVLIASAIILITGRMVFDLAETEHGGKIGKPGIYAVGMLALFYIFPVMVLATPLLAMACVVRCRNAAVGIVVTLIALLTSFVLLSERLFRWLLPAYFLGRLWEASLGYYVGGVIQIATGAWLLGWFNKRGMAVHQSKSAKNNDLDTN